MTLAFVQGSDKQHYVVVCDVREEDPAGYDALPFRQLWPKDELIINFRHPSEAMSCEAHFPLVGVCDPVEAIYFGHIYDTGDVVIKNKNEGAFGVDIQGAYVVIAAMNLAKPNRPLWFLTGQLP